MSTLISKTTFLEFLMCPKNIWLKLHRPELMKLFSLSAFELQLAEQGNEVEAYARNLFPGGVLVTETGDEAVRETERFMLAEIPAIFQATFVVDGFIAKNDALAYDKKNACFDLYEIKGTNSIKEEGKTRDHIDDLTFQASVLKRAKVQTGKFFIIHLNKEYVRMGDLVPEELFRVEDMTEKVIARMPQVEEQMEAAKYHLTQTEEPMKGCDCIFSGRSAHCSTFKHSNPQVPEYSIHDLARIGSSKKKLATLVEREVFSLDDVPADVDLSDIQLNQLLVYRNQKPIIDLDAIRAEIEALIFPLYFLDYETFAPAIPMFTGYSPYKRIPFQFSLHILDTPAGEVRHVEYLHEECSDPSEKVAEMLAEHILPEGSVISWNKSFEQGVNRELALRQPDERIALERINTQMYDLRDVFQKQYYVHPDFRGKTSIKKVLPALVEGVRHADLDISEGGAASDAWWQMISPTITEQERAKIAKDLRTYCALDTYAMYQIWKHLRDMVS
ncbi:DUF2779 domain-containing protein [Patescibacteria group bacterium]|nr:MAG: DUF2779 domain-containing protein [Patescibacteria group bacterium]